MTDRDVTDLLLDVPRNPDGSYRAIRVEVKRKGLTVRARAGYFAPSDQ